MRLRVTQWSLNQVTAWGSDESANQCNSLWYYDIGWLRLWQMTLIEWLSLWLHMTMSVAGCDWRDWQSHSGCNCQCHCDCQCCSIAERYSVIDWDWLWLWLTHFTDCDCESHWPECEWFTVSHSLRSLTVIHTGVIYWLTVRLNQWLSEFDRDSQSHSTDCECECDWLRFRLSVIDCDSFTQSHSQSIINQDQCQSMSHESISITFTHV